MSAWRGRSRVAALLAAILAVPAIAGVPGMTGGGGPSPIRTDPLAPGEILLETGGIGYVTTRADLATITVRLSAGGETRAAARRAYQAEARRIVAALRGAGVPADAIATQVGTSGTAVTFSVYPDPAAAPFLDPPGTPAFDESGTLVVRLRNIDKVADVRAALTDLGANAVSGPVYSLTDRVQARHQAQALALAAARADAEAYAAQINMRLVRMVRLTERIGDDMYALAFNNEALFRSLRGLQSPGEPQAEPDIPTIMMLGADFALAPR